MSHRKSHKTSHRTSYEVKLAPRAKEVLEALPAGLRDAMERAFDHRLARHPTRTNRWVRETIDRRAPRYTLRVGPARAFYEVHAASVWVLEVAMLCERRGAGWPRGVGWSADEPEHDPEHEPQRERQKVPLAEAKKRFSKLMRRAVEQPVVITRHGKVAGVLIGFATEEDWLEYRLTQDAQFVRRVRLGRHALRALSDRRPGAPPLAWP